VFGQWFAGSWKTNNSLFMFRVIGLPLVTENKLVHMIGYNIKSVFYIW